MATQITKVPFFSLNLQEFFSLALETLLEDLEGKVAYWFIHPENTEFWDDSGSKIKDVTCYATGNKSFFTKTELTSIKNNVQGISDISLLDQTDLARWNVSSPTTLLVIPIISEGERLATIVVFNIRSTFNLDLFKRKLSLFIRQIQITLRSLQKQSLAFVDDLTGLYNVRAFNFFLDDYFAKAKRFGLYFSVLFIDIDYLKKVNDTYGHLTGSQILREMAKIIRYSCREKDRVFRYGGDEFAVILDNSNAKRAQIIAERIRSKIEDTVFEVKKHLKIKITVCIGIASFPEHASKKEDILQLADQAMYSGKYAHRNTVFLA